jgi:hypothetical protein
VGQPTVAGNRAVVEWWTQMDNEGTPVTLPGAGILDFDEMVYVTRCASTGTSRLVRVCGPSKAGGPDPEPDAVVLRCTKHPGCARTTEGRLTRRRPSLFILHSAEARWPDRRESALACSISSKA